jgi:hypothetical protein
MRVLVMLVLAAGCASQKVRVEPVKVEPIHVTVDVNLHDGRPPPAKP